MTEENAAREINPAAANALAECRRRTEAFCRSLGVMRPVLSAPMSGVAGPELVAAVSEAGGLGVLPTDGMTAGEIREAAARVRELTRRPFAIQIRIAPRGVRDPAELRELANGLSEVMTNLGLADPTTPEGEVFYDFACRREGEAFAERFAAILEIRPAAALSTCGGFREPEAEALFAAGIRNIGTATTLREAKVLRAAKVDAIVAQGAEAGGPRSSFEDRDDVLTGLAALVPAAARATRLPVIAAGGICDPAQALGACVMGASAVMLGTALTGTRESLASRHAKEALAWAGAANLVTTRLYSGRLVRALSSPLIDALADYAGRLPPWPAPERLMRPLLKAAREQGREELEAVLLGQSVGRSLDASAAEAVRRISSLLA